jgi:hypothetical protein
LIREILIALVLSIKVKEVTISDKVQEKVDVEDGDNAENKKEFTEPKLEFVEPKLTKQGDATKITGQFFSTLLA